MSTSFLCSLAADLLMTRLLRWLLGMGAPQASEMVEYSGFNHQATTSPLRRNPDCPCDHVAWQRVRGRPELADNTVAELLTAAGCGSGGARSTCSVTVPGHHFAERTGCGCAGDRDLRRFVVPTASAGRCRRCGERLQVGPFFSHSEVPVELLEDRLDRPLRDLGVQSTGSVLVRAGHRVVQFRPQVETTAEVVMQQGVES